MRGIHANIGYCVRICINSCRCLLIRGIRINESDCYGCYQPGQKHWLIILNKLPHILLLFGLSVTGSACVADKHANPINENQTLKGTAWSVEDIAGKGVVDMSHTTIEFTDDDRIVGDTGCNRYFGSVELAEASIKVGILAGTRMACVPALMDQERSFYQAINEATTWEIAETGLLHLRNADGVDQLRASRTTDP